MGSLTRWDEPTQVFVVVSETVRTGGTSKAWAYARNAPTLHPFSLEVAGNRAMTSQTGLLPGLLPADRGAPPAKWAPGSLGPDQCGRGWISGTPRARLRCTAPRLTQEGHMGGCALGGAAGQDHDGAARAVDFEVVRPVVPHLRRGEKLGRSIIAVVA